MSALKQRKAKKRWREYTFNLIGDNAADVKST